MGAFRERLRSGWLSHGVLSLEGRSGSVSVRVRDTRAVQLGEEGSSLSWTPIIQANFDIGGMRKKVNPVGVYPFSKFEISLASRVYKLHESYTLF